MQTVPSAGGAAPATSSNQRRADRFEAGMPFTLDGVEGHTRDLSATGLSFDSDKEYAVGDIVKLTVRYTMDGHNFPMPCEVEVVRVQHEGERFLVAARLCRPFFDVAP